MKPALPVALALAVALAGCRTAAPAAASRTLRAPEELPALFDAARGHARYIVAFSPT